MLQIESTPLKDCFVITPPVFKDERGVFSETFNKKAFYEASGLKIDFVQDNQSSSSYGVLRGLHYQTGDQAQAKLVRVVAGKVLDIVVDIRRDSETFGQHFSTILSAENNKQLFVPKGFAHGFVTLSKHSIFCYKCDQFYDKSTEGGIHFNDATLALDWHLPHDELIISKKDLELPSFSEAMI